MGKAQMEPTRVVVGYRPLTRLHVERLKGPASVAIQKVLEQYPDGWFPEPRHYPTRKEARAALIARGVAKKDIKLRKVTRRFTDCWEVSILDGYSDSGEPQWKTVWGRYILTASLRESLRNRCRAQGVPPRLVLGCRLRWRRVDSRVPSSQEAFVIERFRDYPRMHLSELTATFRNSAHPEGASFTVQRTSNQTPAELVERLKQVLREKGPEFVEAVTLRHFERRELDFKLRCRWRKGPPPNPASVACAKRKSFTTYKQAAGAAFKMKTLYKKHFIVQGCPECGGFHLAQHRGKRESGRAYPKVTA